MSDYSFAAIGSHLSFSPRASKNEMSLAQFCWRKGLYSYDAIRVSVKICQVLQLRDNRRSVSQSMTGHPAACLPKVYCKCQVMRSGSLGLQHLSGKFCTINHTLQSTCDKRQSGLRSYYVE